MTVALAPEDLLTRLAGLGLPVPQSQLCDTVDDAAAIAEAIGGDGAVALKAAGLLHKSDHGGVVLGLRGIDEVRVAAEEMLERVGSEALPFLVQEMSSGLEVLVGARRHPELGVTVTVGMGGTATEVHRDVVTVRAPVEDPRSVLRRLRIWPLLDGFRGAARRDVAALCQVITTVSQLALDDATIAELDLNPVLVQEVGQGVCVVDARLITVPDSEVPTARPGPSNLERMMSPRHVVVVGVSDDPDKVGARLFRYLRSHGYAGRLDAVHPQGGEVGGLTRYRTLSEVPGSPDLVCVTIPSRAVPDVAREAVAKSCGALLVHSSDFAETGEEGRSQQAELARVCADGGLPLAGPNNMGIVVPRLGLAASISGGLEEPLVAGRAALLTSSGALGSCLATRLMGDGIGLSAWLHGGNEAGLVLADFLAHSAADEHTRTAGLLLEDLKDGDRFVEAGRAMAAQRKPVFAYNMARSDKGREAALSHTGALVDSFAAREAVLEAACVVSVDSLRELEDAVMLAATGPLPAGNRLVAVTFSGGACAIIADATEGTDVEMPELSEATRDAVRSHVPPYSAVRNPFDLSYQMVTRDDDFEQVLTKLTAAGEFDAVLVQFTTNADPYAARLAERVVALRDRLDVPMYVSRYGGAHLATKALARYAELGVTVLDAPDRATKAIAALMRAGSMIAAAGATR
jgi:acyl-CoA synthetase (NDP forming)